MIHTPKKSAQYLAELNDRLPIKLEDSSWGNDASDSAECLLPNGRTLRVWFPNPKEDQCYTKFAVCHKDYENDEEDTFLSHNGEEQMTLNQSIKAIKSYISSIQTA